jgi:transposase
MMVCSPGAIPRQPGDQIKTNARDALKLARLHAAGQLRAVVVLAPELEALRDLVRAREDLRGDLMSAWHRISKLLLRRGVVWGGPGETWSTRHLLWLSAVRLDQPLVEVVFGECLAHHEVLLARRDRLDG